MAGAQDRCAYFLETEQQPITSAHPAWKQNLPGGRGCFHSDGRPGEAIPFTVGEYFLTARKFLDRAGPTAAAERIRIHLAKHGPLYHPAKVAAEMRGVWSEFVLNVALSDAGRDRIGKEFETLQRLRQEVSPDWLPAVFELGEVERCGGPAVPMFLGEWLSGFHEFHLTRCCAAGEVVIVVWDPENGSRFLKRAEALAVYAGAARILTRYFSLATGECIGAWHHAAGDFVVSLAGAQPAVRLITVRDFRPMRRHRPAAGSPLSELMESLLLFFLNMSIRMRLDRWDGVGEVAWSETVAVEGSLEGFLAELSAKPELPGTPLPLDLLFRHYALSLSQGYLLDMCRGLLATFHPHSPDLPVASAHLAEHAAALTAALSRR